MPEQPALMDLLLAAAGGKRACGGRENGRRRGENREERQEDGWQSAGEEWQAVEGRQARAKCLVTEKRVLVGRHVQRRKQVAPPPSACSPFCLQTTHF
jgi:hypothetical protein